jgi:hypothetical protein
VLDIGRHTPKRYLQQFRLFDKHDVLYSPGVQCRQVVGRQVICDRPCMQVVQVDAHSP